jgi:Zn-finger nucleic acid-binding protein
MIVLEIENVEIDHCVVCKGTWLDAGELSLLLEGADNKDQLLSSMDQDADTNDCVRVGRYDDPASEPQRPCPICEKKMRKILFSCGGSEGVMVDKCRHNDGLWFDEGELTGIMDMGDFPCEHRIYELLNNVFGNNARSDR